MRVALMGSGLGANADAILLAIKKGELKNIEVVGVISDKENAGILEVAKRYGVEGMYIHPGVYRTKLEGDAEKRYIETLQKWGAELVVLVGFMRVVKQGFLIAFNNKVINLHPSLLPAFKGLNAIKQAYNYGVKYAGCTVHWVVEELDAGRIIDQEVVEVRKGESLESLKERVHVAEHRLIVRAMGGLK